MLRVCHPGIVVWLCGTVAGGCLLLLAGPVGCRGPEKPRDVQKIVGYGLVAEYDSNRDRLVRFSPRGRFNLLHVADLDRPPSPGGQYTFFGGMYTWITPQEKWGTSGEAWRVDPAMDTGPAFVQRHAIREFDAVGPVLHNGLQQFKRISLERGGHATMIHRLVNTTDEHRTAGIWVNTAVAPGSTIAILTPRSHSGDPMPVQRRGVSYVDDATKVGGHETASATWNAVTQQRGRWTVISTKRYYWWNVQGSEFKAWIPSDRVVAIHNKGYWLIRIGDEWRPVSEIALPEHGHTPVEVYGNYASRMFEVGLLGPIEPIEPGTALEYRERWYIVPARLPRLVLLDRALHAIDPVRFPLPEPSPETDEPVDWMDEDDLELGEAMPIDPTEPPHDEHEPEGDEPFIDIDAPQRRP